VLHSEDVDAQHGLSSAEAAARAERFGPNRFAAGQTESRWHAFARQYAAPMQLVLLAAGIGSLYPLKQLGTGLLLILLTLFNAVDGLQQEGKAAAAVSALQKMVIIKAKVRRDGQLAEIPAGQLESLPVAKGTDPVAGADTALGDRTDMVYMNTMSPAARASSS
jgi:Ca2+-transporting ATPase